MSNIGNKIVNNKFLIIALLLLIFLSIIFFVHLYFNIRAYYFPNKKEDTLKQSLFYLRLKYIIIFAFFLILLTILYLVNPYNVIGNYFGSVILISILIGTIIISMLSFYNYAYKKEGNGLNVDVLSKEKSPPPMNFFYRSLLFLLFGGLSAGLLFLLVYLIDPLSKINSVITWIINVLIIVIILALVYKIFNINNNSTILSLVIKIFSFLFSFIKNVFVMLFNHTSREYHSTTFSSIIILLIMILLFYLFYKLPNFSSKINLQGGKQIINKPINLDNLSIIASYDQLNGSDTFEYQYAISFWIFINSYPPNTNFSYETYVSILNYGNKPNVLFNVRNNSLMITMPSTDIIDSDNNPIEVDANGNRIIYVKDNFLLQKWNNIIINYSGGTLDIFINGELVKSTIGIVPYMQLDNLSVGSHQGIGGGICNVVYYNFALTSNNIYYIYNTVKNKAPPIVDDLKDTILKT